MHHDLIQTVERFVGRRVLLVGDFMLDRYIFGDAERISPEAPVPVVMQLEGTNVEIARKMLKEANIEQLRPARGLTSAAKQVCACVSRRIANRPRSRRDSRRADPQGGGY